jgi:hypothetical protein
MISIPAQAVIFLLFCLTPTPLPGERGKIACITRLPPSPMGEGGRGMRQILFDVYLTLFLYKQKYYAKIGYRDNSLF